MNEGVVWGSGAGGTIGVIMLGLFATKSVNAAGADGLLFGNSAFFFKQTVAVVGASIYAFVFTYVMLKVINTFTPVAVSKDEETAGVDETLHGENAYL